MIGQFLAAAGAGSDTATVSHGSGFRIAGSSHHAGLGLGIAGANLDELAAEDSEVAEYVKALEESKDAAELPEVSGDSIAKEFERYLRRQKED